MQGPRQYRNQRESLGPEPAWFQQCGALLESLRPPKRKVTAVTCVLPPSTCFRYLGPSGRVMQANSTPGCRRPQRHAWKPLIIKQQWAFAPLPSAAQQQKHSSVGNLASTLCSTQFTANIGVQLCHFPEGVLPSSGLLFPALCTTVYEVTYKRV